MSGPHRWGKVHTFLCFTGGPLGRLLLSSAYKLIISQYRIAKTANNDRGWNKVNGGENTSASTTLKAEKPLREGDANVQKIWKNTVFL